MELEKSWASAMHQDHCDFAKHHAGGKTNSISQQKRQRFRPMWRVREHMAFLIRNLQFYIQVIYQKIYAMCLLVVVHLSFAEIRTNTLYIGL